MAAKKKVKNVRVVKQDKNNFIMVLAIIAVLSCGLYYFVSGTMSSKTTSYDMTPEEVADNMMVKEVLNPVVVVNEQNNSNEYGNATLTEKDGKVVVSIKINNAPKGVSQPAHLHTGSCISLGGVSYSLTNVMNGVSETTLNVSLEELKAKLPLALNVHKSVTQSSVYVACGNLELQ